MTVIYNKSDNPDNYNTPFSFLYQSVILIPNIYASSVGLITGIKFPVPIMGLIWSHSLWAH
jgi:hypothetical protein